MKILNFVLDEKFFGIETKYIKEVNRNIEYTKIPLSPMSVIGLFNMRGQIVTLLNLKYYLNEEKCEFKSKCNCIILKEQENKLNHIGFLIDKVEDIVDIDEDCFETSPININDNFFKYIKKVAKLEKRLILLIDMTLFLNES